VVRLTGKTVTCVLALDPKQAEDTATAHPTGRPGERAETAARAATLSSEAGA
jgi:hypothetical protein